MCKIVEKIKFNAQNDGFFVMVYIEHAPNLKQQTELYNLVKAAECLQLPPMWHPTDVWKNHCYWIT